MITSVGGPGAVADAAEVVDLAGNYLLPGFIDLHCHGDGKRDFFRDPEEVVSTLLAHGTTTVLATLGYNDMERGRIDRQVSTFWAGLGPRARDVVRGVHLEGPYVNPRYGALADPGASTRPVAAEYEPILALGSAVVRLWTVAPELEGIAVFAERAAQAGIALAAGHAEATAAQCRDLLPCGLRLATHWSNATGHVPPRHRGTRVAGVEEFALMTPSVAAELICDERTLHVPADLVQLLYKVKGAQGIILISDAYFAEGDRGGDVILTDDGELCGSRLCVADAVRHFQRVTGCTLPELSRVAALNAAEKMGWSRELGSIEVGKRANLVALDSQLRLVGTWLSGRAVPRQTTNKKAAVSAA